MDATCNVQDSIHVFHLVHNMCPGFWVHINYTRVFLISSIAHKQVWHFEGRSDNRGGSGESLPSLVL